MTERELEQILDLRREIRDIEAKLVTINTRKMEIVHDKVQTSSKEWPFIRTNLTIQGISEKTRRTRERELSQQQDLLNERLEQCTRLETRITEFINNVDDSNIRRIIEYRYIDRKTWDEIGKIMHMHRTNPEKVLSKYLRQNRQV